MSGCLDNLQIPNIDVGEKRNKYASIISGVLVSIFHPTTKVYISRVQLSSISITFWYFYSLVLHWLVVRSWCCSSSSGKDGIKRCVPDLWSIWNNIIFHVSCWSNVANKNLPYFSIGLQNILVDYFIWFFIFQIILGWMRFQMGNWEVNLTQKDA